MEIFFAFLALSAGNSPITGEFPSQRPVTRSVDVFFICAWANSWVNNPDAGDLRRHRTHHCNANIGSDNQHERHPIPIGAIGMTSFLSFLAKRSREILPIHVVQLLINLISQNFIILPAVEFTKLWYNWMHRISCSPMPSLRWSYSARWHCNILFKYSFLGIIRHERVPNGS